MDAVKYITERERMCEAFNSKACEGCGINERLNGKIWCEAFVKQHPAEAVEIVEKWSEEHPIKTRQNEFLKMFPNSRTDDDGIMRICPGAVDLEFACPIKSWDCYDSHCADCRKEFWLAEIKDDEAATE